MAASWPFVTPPSLSRVAGACAGVGPAGGRPTLPRAWQVSHRGLSRALAQTVTVTASRVRVLTACGSMIRRAASRPWDRGRQCPDRGAQRRCQPNEAEPQEGAAGSLGRGPLPSAAGQHGAGQQGERHGGLVVARVVGLVSCSVARSRAALQAGARCTTAGRSFTARLSCDGCDVP